MSRKGKGKANVIDRVLFLLDLDHPENTAKMGKVLEEEKSRNQPVW